MFSTYIQIEQRTGPELQYILCYWPVSVLTSSVGWRGWERGEGVHDEMELATFEVLIEKSSEKSRKKCRKRIINQLTAPVLGVERYNFGWERGFLYEGGNGQPWWEKDFSYRCHDRQKRVRESERVRTTTTVCLLLVWWCGETRNSCSLVKARQPTSWTGVCLCMYACVCVCSVCVYMCMCGFLRYT